jgi:hypothetical protein
MTIADRQDYVRFLYLRLPALRARHFRYALEAAASEGRIAKSSATLSDRGVHLREPALLPQAGTPDVFEIDFAQMPRLAAFLDFLHNALGFTVVADLLAPILQRAPTNHADEVARTLQAALNAWLSQRLETANHIQQARRIRSFLASRGRGTPEAIEDEDILLFWVTMAELPDEEQVDGFRLYRSVAAAMLRYRGALRDAAVAKHLEDALGGGFEPANEETATDDGRMQIEAWQSPLKTLALPPANRVKWLTEKEQQWLLNYLGGSAGEDAEAEGIEADDEVGPWRDGLCGEERFELAYWLTLLRADVFGAVQASIVGRLRKRASASEAIAQAMAQINGAAFTTCTGRYAALREQLQLDSLAAMSVLMQAGAAEAVILMNHLAGQDAVRSVIGFKAGSEWSVDAENIGEDSIGDQFVKAIGGPLKAAAADPSSIGNGAARKLLLDALAATRKVARVGFRRDDRADSTMIAALRSGAAGVIGVIVELDRLVAVLSEKAAFADIASDNRRFHAAFQRIYGSVTAP